MSNRTRDELEGVVTTEFAKEHLKVCVAKMCKRIGWDSITQTALFLLVDLLYCHIRKIITTASKYCTCYDESNLNVTHVCLALAELGHPCVYTNPGGREFNFLPAKTQTETARLDLETRTFMPGFIEVHKWLKKCKKNVRRQAKRQRKEKRKERDNLDSSQEHLENEPPKEPGFH